MSSNQIKDCLCVLSATIYDSQSSFTRSSTRWYRTYHEQKSMSNHKNDKATSQKSESEFQKIYSIPSKNCTYFHISRENLNIFLYIGMELFILHQSIYPGLFDSLFNWAVKLSFHSKIIDAFPQNFIEEWKLNNILGGQIIQTNVGRTVLGVHFFFGVLLKTHYSRRFLIKYFLLLVSSFQKIFLLASFGQQTFVSYLNLLTVIAILKLVYAPSSKQIVSATIL